MGLLAQVGQQRALFINHLRQRTRALLQFFVGQRVAPAGFRKTAHQRVALRIHVDQPHLGPGVAQPLELLGHQVQALGAARIHRNGHAAAVLPVLQ